MADLSAGVLVLLALIGVVGGVGISAVGPGGVLPTIGLFALTPLAPAVVAGTAIATNIACGIAGTAAFTASGQLRDAATRRTALILAAAAVLGTPPGVVINTHVSKKAFGILLAVFAVAVAVLVWWRGRQEAAAGHAHPRTWVLVVLGAAVGLVSGVLGLGGPMLTVPLLLAIGVGVLESLAAAQVQSIVIASVGTIGYAIHGSVDWGLVLLIGAPELAGVIVGWRIARALPTATLRGILVVVLLALAPYLALR
ncbi:MAG TPA: sulfite exporter TauE/SafE family protein [Mycobacteriales bacterium]|nr:sulfite exporter TauE/SafE family protein [Mycobacteriales bacterium]